MAEIELSVLSRQALNQRIPGDPLLQALCKSYERRRNKQRATITWKFTTHDARRVFKYKMGN